MKKLLSIFLSVAMVATLFVGTAVQQVSAAETTDSTEPTKEYRYESIYDFSQEIPETIHDGGEKYTSEQVQDDGKWAWKLTQSVSTWDGDYSTIKFSELITIPTNAEIPYNEDIVGIRMVYRFATPTDGNIGIVHDGGWTFRFSEHNQVYNEGSFDQTLFFADYTSWPAVKPGNSYQFYFEPRSKAGKPFEIYVYDMQFVYEVVTPAVNTLDPDKDYRFESIYDFSQEIPEVTFHNGEEYTSEHVQDNGKWAWKIAQVRNTWNGSQTKIRLNEKITIPTNAYLPYNEKIVGIRMVYRFATPTDGNIGIIYDGGWTFRYSEQNQEYQEGLFDQTLLFANYTSWPAVKPGNSYDFYFEPRSKDGVPSEIYVYDMQFVYEVTTAVNTLDPDKDYRFESIYDFSQEIPETIHDGGEEYTSEQVEDNGKWAWKLKQSVSTWDGDFSTIKFSELITMPTGEGLPINERLIGMRMVYRLATPTDGNIGIVYDGAWTFRYSEHNKVYNEGIVDQTLMFADYTSWPAVKPGNSYQFYFEPRSKAGKPFEIYVYDMQFVYEVDTPCNANFVDTFGISGKEDICTIAGYKNHAVVFPEASLEAAEVPYNFLGWSKTEGGAIIENDTHTGEDVTYYAVWCPNLVIIKKVLLKAMTTPDSVTNDINADTSVDVRDLIWLKEYEVLSALEGAGKDFLVSPNKPIVEETAFPATVAEGEYVQVNFDTLTSVNTFTLAEETQAINDLTIKAWNGKEWVRVYRITGTEECDRKFVLEQDVMTYALRLYANDLADGSETATITAASAEWTEVERAKTFGLTGFIGDSAYKHGWITPDSDTLMKYDDIILINNWQFDENGELVVSVSLDEGHTRTAYAWDSDEGKQWSETFLNNYNGYYDDGINEEDKPNLWVGLTILKDGNWDDTINNFKPSSKEWYEGIGQTYQPGESDAFGDANVRKALIDNVIAYVQEYDFYGVDVDWEYPYGSEQQEDYYNLLKELGAALHAIGKKLSIDQLLSWCTLPYEYYNDEAIDRVNLMLYSQDMTSDVNAIQKYANAGVDLSKLYLGVPFYGDSSEEDLSAIGWSGNVDTCYQDYDRGVNTYDSYTFNSANMLQDKTLLALEKELGGVMVWWLNNEYTKANATKTGGEYIEELTLSNYLRDTVDRFTNTEN